MTAPARAESVPAPLGRRALAAVADLVIVGIVALIITSLVSVPRLLWDLFGIGSLPQVPRAASAVFAAVFFVVYEATCLWLTQRTAGKAMLGLRVERPGRPVGLVWALGRSTVGYLVFGIGAPLALWDRRRRTLHDRVFGSVVVLERTDPVRASGLWKSLLAFEQERETARDEKTKSLHAFKGFVKYLLGLGSPLTMILTRLSGAPAAAGEGSASASSAAAPAATLAVKATVVVVLMGTAVAGGVAVTQSGQPGPAQPGIETRVSSTTIAAPDRTSRSTITLAPPALPQAPAVSGQSVPVVAEPVTPLPQLDATTPVGQGSSAPQSGVDRQGPRPQQPEQPAGEPDGAPAPEASQPPPTPASSGPLSIVSSLLHTVLNLIR